MNPCGNKFNFPANQITKCHAKFPIFAEFTDTLTVGGGVVPKLGSVRGLWSCDETTAKKVVTL